jgi:hypothetical protein
MAIIHTLLQLNSWIAEEWDFYWGRCCRHLTLFGIAIPRAKSFVLLVNAENYYFVLNRNDLKRVDFTKSEEQNIKFANKY